MCTAISYKTNNHYFGRNLDIEIDYGQKIIIMGRNFPLKFRAMPNINNHFAIIGTAVISDNYPLYFDATNEKGLSIAGLNFPNNAIYNQYNNDKDNITPFEFIPWILSMCKDTNEANTLIKRINFINISFSDQYPLSPLHWIISDNEKSITVESVKDGIKVYENPVGVLTNNPTFDYHLTNLNNYMTISNKNPVNNFSEKLSLKPYSLGMGSLGLPGDMSSSSRFVKAVFTKYNSISSDEENESISQFFHILDSVSQPKGCTNVKDNKYEYTVYSSCCNTDKCIYYYKTYYCNQINAIEMKKENLNSDALLSYEMLNHQNINYQN